MLLLAGLGNPGAKYASHRHNVGFMAADRIWDEHSFSPWKARFQALIAEGKLDGEKTLLIKPTTFMNNSGQAIGEILRYFKLDPSDVVIMYDELDLPPGKLRMKTGGGAGGHNGIRSIDAHIGKEYRRMRIGIGHPGEKPRVHNHVLGDFAKADAQWRDPLLDEIARHAPLLAKGDDSSFMNKVHLALAPEKPDNTKSEPKRQSHVRQARQKKPQLPKSGPMAEMLNKLLGNKPE